MNLYDRAKRDVQRYTTDEKGWAESLLLSTPDGLITATFAALKSKVHLNVDGDGNLVNSRKSHITISEPALLAANPTYPIRNAGGEVDIKGHKVSLKDSTGTINTFIINQAFPDETIGLIVCILGSIDVS